MLQTHETKQRSPGIKPNDHELNQVVYTRIMSTFFQSEILKQHDCMLFNKA